MKPCLLIGWLVVASSLNAKVTLAPLFRDHLVLQREKPIAVWGQADPGESVSVGLGSDVVSTVADRGGDWSVRLPARPASSTPLDLVVRGQDHRIVRDILVGEVWLCSGQSNMGMLVRSARHAEAEIAASANPLIRHFRVEPQPQSQPAVTVAGAWQVCSPATVGGFSATAYFFAREVQHALNVPVGVITSAYGNTHIAAWRSAQGLANEPVVAAWWKHQLAAQTPPRPHRQPSSCYNGMIHPLVPFTVRGILWYQGEADATETPTLTRLYSKQLPALVREWRQLFGAGDPLPFFWVQLAGLGEPGGRDWVGLREAQTQSLTEPHTGQAIAIDIGDVKEIHALDKQAVGDRLARLALHRVYGRDIVDQGPEPEAIAFVDGAVRIRFRGAQGLTANGDLPATFAVAGADRHFQPATSATIEGTTVIVQSSGVTHPVAVRYAWTSLPPGTLANQAGLPAGPFRSDAW